MHLNRYILWYPQYHHSRLNTAFVTRGTRRAPLVKHAGTANNLGTSKFTLGFCGDRVARSIDSV